MQIRPLTTENRGDFIEYCTRYGREHDESYLPAPDFTPDEYHPGYLLYGESGSVLGTICLIRKPSFVADHKGRILIFHTRDDPSFYRALLEAIAPHFFDLDFIYLFVPEQKTTVRNILESLGFSIERYSYLLKHALKEFLPPIVTPAGIRVVPVEDADTSSLQRICEITNRCFAKLAGHVHQGVDDLRARLRDGTFIDGGLMVIYMGENPAGTVYVHRDDDEPESAFVDSLAVNPQYRGRGLGRFLIRKSIEFAAARGFERLYLSVNAENEVALTLYESEGFSRDRCMVCLRLDVGPHSHR